MNDNRKILARFLISLYLYTIRCLYHGKKEITWYILTMLISWMGTMASMWISTETSTGRLGIKRNALAISLYITTLLLGTGCHVPWGGNRSFFLDGATWAREANSFVNIFRVCKILYFAYGKSTSALRLPIPFQPTHQIKFTYLPRQAYLLLLFTRFRYPVLSLAPLTHSPSLKRPITSLTYYIRSDTFVIIDQ